jgi:DNA-nicking Smr family endonuclease
VSGAGRFVIDWQGEDVFARAADVSRRQLADLRAGRVEVDAELDLHGLAAAEARRALESALADALRDGLRCLLVIHGAGHHSVSGPVLKRQVPDWLANARAAGDILAFATAPAQHGGRGACLVLLRRARARER